MYEIATAFGKELINDEWFAEEDEIILDNVKGGALHPVPVREGQRLEMEGVRRLIVFTEVPRAQALREPRGSGAVDHRKRRPSDAGGNHS